MIRRLWRHHRALVVMRQHERWRVAMGCPGVPHWIADARADPSTPRLGEVYCRCDACHYARALVGWAPLP